MTASSFSSIRLSPQQQAFLRHWINFHRVLWVLTLVSFFIAWNRGLALLYGLFSLLTALLSISYLMPFWQLRNIRGTRACVDEFTAGRPGVITYFLEAEGARYHVELSESLEFAEKKEQHYFFSRISGRTSCKLQFTCRQRGCFRLKDIHLSSAYPFGIVQFSKRIKTDPLQILVLPKVVALSRLPRPVAADVNTWGDCLILQKGGRDEYSAVREYRHGDELNRIHWPVSARHQNLVVKEYEKTDRPALLVVLDCRHQFNVGQGHRSTFEFAVTIAASMIRFASRQGIQCFWVSRQDRFQELTVAPYSTDLYVLYETLARLNCDSRYPYPLLVERAQRRFPQANLITTFRLDTDAIRPQLSPLATGIELEMNVKSFRSAVKGIAENTLRKEDNRLIYGVCANSKLETLFQ